MNFSEEFMYTKYVYESENQSQIKGEYYNLKLPQEYKIT